ncbi:hypothetical protein F5Y04DRAFT_245779 [Hypomontagnella monticulosa]|nr:hypothetical protein F5Y04DRAFT_245779 [Hypomontagnella monticulosa]
MKYAAVLALLPLASAANFAARQASDVKFEISDFAAACTAEDTLCFYELSVVASDNPNFKVGCSVSGTSDTGELPAVEKTKCGTFSVSVAKADNGGLVMTVTQDSKRQTGTYTIPSSDITTTASDAKKIQSYSGKSSFTIDTNGGSSSGSTSSSSTSAPTTSSTSDSSSTSSTAPTNTPEQSTTGTTTSGSAGPSQTNGATRDSAFAGVPFAIGLMAFVL